METKEHKLERYVKLRICQQSLDTAIQNMAIAEDDAVYDVDQDSACMNINNVSESLDYKIHTLRKDILAPDCLSPVGTIGWACERMKDGARVTRAGWNGKGMYLGLTKPSDLSDMTLPYIYIKTVQGDLVPWLCSQTDFLADDWEEYSETL